MKAFIMRSLNKIISQNNTYIEKRFLVHKSATIINSSLVGDVFIEEGCRISKSELNGKISVGRFTSINGPSTAIVSKVNSVSIGAFCSIARNVLIQEYNHKIHTLSTSFIRKWIFDEPYINDISSKGRIQIGNDVWIGANVVVLSGVQIGDGAVVGANSTVTRDIAPYTVVSGSPARKIGLRFDREVVEKLLSLKWWNWSIERIRKNRDLFFDDLTDEKISKIE